MIAPTHFLYKPAGRLSQFVSHFIYFKDFRTDYRIDRFMPNGDIEIVIDLKQSAQQIYDNDSLAPKQSVRKLWLSGIRTAPISIPAGHDAEQFIIFLRPETAGTFLNLYMADVTDSVHDTDSVLPQSFLSMREALGECDGAEAKFALAEAWLTLFAGDRQVHPALSYAAAALRGQPEMTTIASVQYATGYSAKHLIVLFKRELGAGPKTYLRLHRFQKILSGMSKGKPLDWASLALAAGYYDQSHLISDFKHFSGFTPTQYAERRGSNQDYVPVD